MSSVDSCRGVNKLTLNSKIENFIRTKYDSKRWVMDGGIPDPATLDEEGDDEAVSSRNIVYCLAVADIDAAFKRDTANGQSSSCAYNSSTSYKRAAATYKQETEPGHGSVWR